MAIVSNDPERPERVWPLAIVTCPHVHGGGWNCNKTLDFAAWYGGTDDAACTMQYKMHNYFLALKICWNFVALFTDFFSINMVDQAYLLKFHAADGVPAFLSLCITLACNQGTFNRWWKWGIKDSNLPFDVKTQGKPTREWLKGQKCRS